MKKIFAVIMVLLLSFVMYSCQDNSVESIDFNEVKKIEVSSDWKRNYEYGDEFEESELIIYLNSDKKKTIPLTKDMVRNFNTGTIGLNQEATVSILGKRITLVYNVYFNEVVPQIKEMKNNYLLWDEFENGILLVSKIDNTVEEIEITKDMLRDFDTESTGEHITYIDYLGHYLKFTYNVNKPIFEVKKKIENDTNYESKITDFNITINHKYNREYYFTLTTESECVGSRDDFTFSNEKWFYNNGDTIVKDRRNNICNLLGNTTNINNLPQKTTFVLKIGIVDSHGYFDWRYEEYFSTNLDMVRNPYGKTLVDDNPKKTIYEKNGTINADEVLKEEFIPYDLKEWLFEKQLDTLPSIMTKTINYQTYKISSKYLSKLSKNNTIKIGFALIDDENNVFEPKLSDFTVRFVEGIENGQNDKYHKNKNGDIDVVIGRDGVFYFELNNDELLLFKNKYKENYIKFVDDYIFKNYIIEVDYESGKYGNMSLRTPYKMMAMSYHDEMWSYLDYNQNGFMDKSLDANKQYYDKNGKLIKSEDNSSKPADIKEGLDYGIHRIMTMWHQSKIANVDEFKMYRFYTGSSYMYYIMGYNRNNIHIS